MTCRRCNGEGVVLWLGHHDTGGRKGPCPKCRVGAAKKFCADLSRDVFSRRGKATNWTINGGTDQ